MHLSWFTDKPNAFNKSLDFPSQIYVEIFLSVSGGLTSL